MSAEWRDLFIRTALTIFDLCYIPDHYIGHWDLDDLSAPYDGELLFLFDAALEATELFLLAPVIESCDKHHTDDRQQDGSSLDPASLRLAFILRTTSCFPAVCTCKYVPSAKYMSSVSLS